MKSIEFIDSATSLIGGVVTGYGLESLYNAQGDLDRLVAYVLYCTGAAVGMEYTKKAFRNYPADRFTQRLMEMAKKIAFITGRRLEESTPIGDLPNPTRPLYRAVNTPVITKAVRIS